MRGGYIGSLVGSIALVASAFLPWFWLGAVRIAGVPDPAGYFVATVGVVGFILAVLGLVRRWQTGPGLFLAGLAAATTLAMVWTTGGATIGERADMHAQAVALVDNVAVEPPPPVSVGVGLIAGMAAACVTAAGAMAVVLRERRPV